MMRCGPDKLAPVTRAGWLWCLCIVAGCAGAIDPQEGPDGPGPAPGPGVSAGGPPGPPGEAPGTAASCVTPAATGPSLLRRLTNLEYQLTLQDLLRLDAPPALDGLPADPEEEGFRTVTALQTVTTEHLRSYAVIAERLADDLWRAPERRRAVVGCEPEASGCLEAFAARFGQLAFRRPLASEELRGLVDRARKAAASPGDQVRFALRALLGSPSFLFRVELGDPASGKLSRHELASRLSFFLWGRGPGQALLDRAAAGALDRPEGLSAVAAEMIADARTRLFYRSFFRQWLGVEALRAPDKAPRGWSDALLGQMAEETDRVLAEFAWGRAPFFDVLGANHTYATRALATFYGLDLPPEPFARIEFPAGHPRRSTGLLTHPSLLSAKTDGDLIAVRGAWFRAVFLCQPLHVPDGLLDSFQDRLQGLSYLEMLQTRTTEAACAGCHALIDPIGVGFAPFDGVGKHDPRVKIADYRLEPRFEGAAEPRFDGIADLARKLREVPRLSSCLAEHVFLYAHGRHPDPADQCTLETAGRRFVAGGGTFTALLQALVEAPAFRHRRAPTAPAP